MSYLEEGTREWRITDKKSGETRTYIQSELTIDGEAQLFGLTGRVVQALGKEGFPFDKVKDAFGFGNLDATDDVDVGGVQWDQIGYLLGLATTALPWASAECAAILMGEFATDENGRPNKDWPDTVAFMRRSIHMADLIEMLKTFADQNDITRLAAPFVTALIRMGQAPRTTPTAVAG